MVGLHLDTETHLSIALVFAFVFLNLPKALVILEKR